MFSLSKKTGSEEYTTPYYFIYRKFKIRPRPPTVLRVKRCLPLFRKDEIISGRSLKGTLGMLDNFILICVLGT